jgi:signal transduction histidine kinase
LPEEVRQPMIHSRLTPLKTRLLLLVAVALLPVVVFAVAGLVVLGRQQLEQAQRAMVERTRAVLSAVDNELQASIAAAEMLALSRELERGELTRFYEEAQRAVRLRESWETIIVFDPSGQQLLNTALPFDSALPGEVADRESFALHRTSSGPIIGNLAAGPAGQPRFAVLIPVMRGSEKRYVMAAVVNPGTFQKLLERQKVPDEGVITIFESQANVVARSRNAETFVGKPISDSLRQLMLGNQEGWGITQTLDGQTVYSAYSHSAISQWGVAVGIGVGAVNGAIWRFYVIFGSGILLSIALGALVAALLARRIARPIAQLRAAAQAVGRGEVPEIPGATLPEVDEVATALANAAAARSQADRAKDEFLAMLGHELRNPLAAISNAVQVLERRGDSEESQRQAHAIVARQAEHLARITDDLLDVGRVMTGKVVLVRGPMDLAEAVRQSLATLTAAGRLARHKLELKTSPAWIDADPSRIEQIISNLLMNAAKYTPPDSAIEVSVADEHGEAVLRVRDEGIGMEPELVPRVFDLFVQGRTGPDRAQGGLGIGLTLVRRLVEFHGGAVSAESAGPDQGSLFTVRLPAVGRPTTLPQRRKSGPSVTPRRVLIIEDNDDARTMMRLLLEMNGHTVDEASDGLTGVSIALEHVHDVAFIDLGLPCIDGHEVARRIRASPRGARITLVALTGYGQLQDRQSALAAGFDLHMVKPASADLLNRILADLPARAAA